MPLLVGVTGCTKRWLFLAFCWGLVGLLYIHEKGNAITTYVLCSFKITRNAERYEVEDGLNEAKTDLVAHRTCEGPPSLYLSGRYSTYHVMLIPRGESRTEQHSALQKQTRLHPRDESPAKFK